MDSTTQEQNNCLLQFQAAFCEDVGLRSIAAVLVEFHAVIKSGTDVTPGMFTENKSTESYSHVC